MGGLIQDGDGLVVAALPYQLARRRGSSVASLSSGVFAALLDSRRYKKHIDYHSHPYLCFEKASELAPSEVDVSQMEVGEVEVIVQTRRSRSNMNEWRSANGRISISLGRFRFVIAAFRRLSDCRKTGIMLYDEIGLALEPK
jgi:hypothetical protein